MGSGAGRRRLRRRRGGEGGDGDGLGGGGGRSGTAVVERTAGWMTGAETVTGTGPRRVSEAAMETPAQRVVGWGGGDCGGSSRSGSGGSAGDPADDIGTGVGVAWV